MMDTTVIISVHGNTARQLSRCMDSVLAMEGLDFKVRLVTCAVPHDVYWMSRQYMKHKKVTTRWYQDSLGAAGDWNRAVAGVDTEFITFVHCDDTVEPYYLRSLRYCIGDRDICFASLNYVEAYWRRVAYAVKLRQFNLLWRRRTFITDPKVTVAGLVNKNTLPAFALMRRDAWNHLGGYRRWCDWDMWIRAAKMGMTMTASFVPTYNYTVHGYDKSVLEQMRREVREEQGC